MVESPYIIITPAKNEEKYIEETIKSVITQTVLPKCWIIVDDGSTDSTVRIVEKYLELHPFIKLVKRGINNSRNFGNKVYAIKRGFEEVKEIEFYYYCNLDADISFQKDYFEILLKKFEENSNLGICGGKVYDIIDGKPVAQKSRPHSVAGPVQFFRKSCYNSFGGYVPSPIGFIDGYAEISARMNGWRTQTFNELIVLHHRPEGTYRGTKLKHCYEGGQIEYLFGYSYVYHLLRNLKIIFDKPFIIGYLTKLAGYHWLLLTKKKRIVDKKFSEYVKKEQLERLFPYFRRMKK